MGESDKRISSHLTDRSCPPCYVDFLSQNGRALKHEVVRLHVKKVQTSAYKLVPLSAGMPSPAMYPIETADIHMKDGTTLHLNETHIRTATNYGIGEGLAVLRQWLEELQRREHRPPVLKGEGQHLMIMSGLIEGIHCVQDAFVDIDDTVLVDTELALEQTNMLQMRSYLEPVRHDDQGMLVDHLEEILSTWHQRHPDRKLPKLLYAPTAGNNPTGYLWGKDRLLDVYLLCRKYNLLILENGADFYIHSRGSLPSFQSMDIDGRVIRFDELSSILGDGLGMCWVSGPDFLIDKIAMAIQFSTNHANNLAQVVIYNILRSWGHEDFRDHVQEIACIYQKRAMSIREAADKHLSGLATWSVPEAGSSVWIHLQNTKDSTTIIEELLSKNVMAFPGHLFTTSTESSDALFLAFPIQLVQDSDIHKAFQAVSDVLKTK